MVDSEIENPAKSKLKVTVPGNESNQQPMAGKPVFVTVINPPPEFVSGDSSHQKLKGRKKGVNSGNDSGKKGSKKGVNAGKEPKAKDPVRKKAATSGKVVKQTAGKRKAGKPPLVRSESDSAVVKKNRRKSTTPQRFVSKTTTSSPDWSQIKSLVAGSLTLNIALQKTLDSALSPALANVLSTSKSSSISQKIKKPSPLPLNLDETLRQTLHNALSPVLESVLSPSSFSNFMGHSSQTDSNLGSRVGPDTVPSVDSEAKVLPYLVGPPIPLLETLPRSVPSIPFEICSSGLEVPIVRWLVQKRFGSEDGNMETSDMESSGNKLYTSDDATMLTPDSGSMEISQNETMTSSSFAQSKAAKAVCNSHALSTSTVQEKASQTESSFSKSKVTGEHLHKVAPANEEDKSIANSEASSPPIAKDKFKENSKSLKAAKESKVNSAVASAASSPANGKSKSKANPETSSAPIDKGKSKANPGTSNAAKGKSRSKANPEASSAVSCTASQPVTADGLLQKIKQIKSNLEKKSTNSVKNPAELVPVKKVRGPSYVQSFKLVSPPHPKGTAMKKDLAPNTAVTKSQPGTMAKTSTSTDGSSSSQLAAMLQLPWKLMAGNQVVGIVTEKNGNLDVVAKEDSKAEDNVSQDQGLPVATDMESVVKELGFKTTWNRVQESLQSSISPLGQVLPLVTSYHGSTNIINPLVVEQSSQVNVIPDSVLQSLRKQAAKPSDDETSVTKHRSLHRYKPYSSALLTFSAYRLNASYRNHEKLPLSSLSYANKIDPMKIWCRYELFGKCSDSKCTRQHLREVTLSKAELVDDIIAYSPTLSAGGTENSSSGIKSSGKVTTGLESEKGSSISESIMGTYARNMTDEQILKLAAYNVNQLRSEREGGVIMAEEFHLRHAETIEKTKAKTDTITRYT